MADIAKMIEEIKTMTVVELNSLVKAIEEEFGVSAAAPGAGWGGAAPPAAEPPAEEAAKEAPRAAEAEAAADPAGAEVGIHARVAVLVVPGLLVRVGEDLIGLVDLLELLLRQIRKRIVHIGVRMVFSRQVAIRPFYLIIRCIRRYAEHIIWIFIHFFCSSLFFICILL